MSTGKMFMAQMSRHLPISSNCPAFSGMEKYKGPTRPISFSFNPFSNFFLLSMTRMGGSCSIRPLIPSQIQQPEDNPESRYRNVLSVRADEQEIFLALVSRI